MAMSLTDFQKEYHEYKTTDASAAISEALKLLVIDETGQIHTVVPMKFGNEYCLLLDPTARVVKEVLAEDQVEQWDKEREKRKTAQYWARKNKKA